MTTLHDSTGKTTQKLMCHYQHFKAATIIVLYVLQFLFYTDFQTVLNLIPRSISVEDTDQRADNMDLELRYTYWFNGYFEGSYLVMLVMRGW